MKKFQKLAKELNDVMQLNPKIVIDPKKTTENKLIAKIEEAADLFNEEDEENLSEAAITQLKQMGIWINQDKAPVEEKTVFTPAEPDLDEEVAEMVETEQKKEKKPVAKKIPIKKVVAGTTGMSKNELFFAEIKKAGKKGITMKDIKSCTWNTANGTFYSYAKVLLAAKKIKSNNGVYSV